MALILSTLGDLKLLIFYAPKWEEKDDDVLRLADPCFPWGPIITHVVFEGIKISEFEPRVLDHKLQRNMAGEGMKNLKS